MAAVCIRQNKMNLPAVNIQTDSGADVMTFLQVEVGPGSALRTCLLYKYKLTTWYTNINVLSVMRKKTLIESLQALWGSGGAKYCKTTARKV